jgi:hypothetical protein
MELGSEVNASDVGNGLWRWSVEMAGGAVVALTWYVDLETNVLFQVTLAGKEKTLPLSAQSPLARRHSPPSWRIASPLAVILRIEDSVATRC